MRFNRTLKMLALTIVGAACLTAHAQDFNGNGLKIQRPAGVLDGWNGGLSVIRDAGQLTGGRQGFVNSGNSTHTTAGLNEVSFEWGVLSVLDNYASGGENVAIYGQGNALGKGVTWGMVAEVADTLGQAHGTWGMEIDNWTTGPDNGYRYGLGIMVGDAGYIRGIRGPSQSDATYGLIIGANTPWSKWQHGIVVKSAAQTGIVLQGVSTRGIWLQGQNIVGMDYSDARLNTAQRLAIGQKICFDKYDQFCVQENEQEELVFTKAGSNVMRLTAGGHLYIAGQVHEGQQ